MIQSDVKKYLERIKTLETLIHNKKIELEQLESLATGVTVPTDREAVQTSNVSDKVGECAARIADLKTEINIILACYLSERTERIKVIEQIMPDNPVQYDLLFKKYVEYKPLKDIASELNLSYSYVLELHREALEKVSNILKNSKKPM